MTTTAKAFWNDTLIAESNETVVVDNNHYFPPTSVDSSYLEPSDHTSICGWKGVSHYHNVIVSGEKNENSAWFYPQPKGDALNIASYIAFWKGIKIEVTHS